MRILIAENELTEVPILGNDFEGKVVGENRGRTLGRGNLQELSKELIIKDRLEGKKVEDVAKIHGVAPSTVTQTSKEKIKLVAENKLLESLEIFSPGALEQNELPGAAIKLAGVIEKVSDKSGDGNNTNIQFIVVNPGLRKEEEYRTIEVKE